jgi:hypothetical protein
VERVVTEKAAYPQDLLGRLRSLAFTWSQQSEQVPDSLNPEVVAAQIAANEIYGNCAFELDELLDEECHARSPLLGAVAKPDEGLA